MFLVTGGTAVIFVYYQNGENLAKSRSSARLALESVHQFYSIRFYIDVGTFASRSGPTFKKIAFNFRYVTLCTFRSLIVGIFEKS